MLEEDWGRQQGEEVLVQSQLKRVQEDLRRINRDIAKGLKKKMTLEEKIGEGRDGRERGREGGGGGQEEEREGKHLCICYLLLYR